ncbi:MAG: hemin-degrading factor [Saprospiraceae bacterium]|nr:hemin-degrading factor [Saprospiraceae bacterium]
MLTLTSLQERYKELKLAKPSLRLREASRMLNVTELELLELNLGSGVVRLSGSWEEMLIQLSTLDIIKAVTSNKYVTNEKIGRYDSNVFYQGQETRDLCEGSIDVRFFLKNWVHAYAVRTVRPKEVLHSLQFFDAYGVAIHKIYLTPKSNPLGFQKLLEKYRAKNQKKRAKLKQLRKKSKASSNITVERRRKFQMEWLQLKDIQDFSSLLTKYKIARVDALQMAPKAYATKIPNAAILSILRATGAREIPMKIMVGNLGCLQIHTGPLKMIEETEQWFKIRGAGFNLLLNRHGVADSWVVKKPARYGLVTSLELFDPNGDMLLSCHGKREVQTAERKEWREIIKQFSSTN